MCAFGAIVRSRCIALFRPASGRCPASLGSQDSGWAVVPPSRGGFAEGPQALIVHVFEECRCGWIQVHRWREIVALGWVRDAKRDAFGHQKRRHVPGVGTCRGGVRT